MSKILVLSTWFPYPCTQGSKTRAYHLIKGLAAGHRLALISFEDEPVQPEWRDHMAQFCEEIYILPRAPFATRPWKEKLGFFSLKPSSVFAGYSREMEELVRETAAAWQPDLVFALTFVTAPYALQVPRVRRVVDMDNLTALMLKEAAESAVSLPQRLRANLAWLKFRRYEDRLFTPFDLCLATSELDTQRVREYTRVRPGQAVCVPNGVDLAAFTIAPVAKNTGELVYNGALTYSMNYDAMQYFLAEIFPLIREEYPACTIKITGKTEGAALDGLRLDENVLFTGFVPDIRPVVAGAEVCVVPLRGGGGTRLKILEAMALGTAVVSTSKGAEGLEIEDGYDYLRADTPQDFAQAVLRLLEDPPLQAQLSAQARHTVEEKYGWDEIGARFLEIVNKLPM